MSISTPRAPKRESGDAVLGATRRAAEARMSRRMSTLAPDFLTRVNQRPPSIYGNNSRHVMHNLTDEHHAVRVEQQLHKDVLKLTRSQQRMETLGTHHAASDARIGGTHSAAADEDAHKNRKDMINRASSHSQDGHHKHIMHPNEHQNGSGVIKTEHAHDQKTSETKYVEMCTPVEKWRPKCGMRYATLWPMPEKPQEQPKEDSPPPVQDPPAKYKLQDWCGCCMQEGYDPYVLPCGHSFCRRCIVNICYDLREHHKEAIADTRAVMRCPLRNCKTFLPCLPFINGDMRFHKVRPEDKVQDTREKYTLCEEYQLKHYKIKLDLDLIMRKSDDLFDGFDDVKIIP